jgi:hypothetical protein
MAEKKETKKKTQKPKIKKANPLKLSKGLIAELEAELAATQQDSDAYCKIVTALDLAKKLGKQINLLFPILTF